jgi:hypothetical protein
MELPKQKAYKKVFELACDELARLDPGEQGRNAGVAFRGAHGGGTFEVPYFDEVLTIKVPGFSFRSSKDANVTLVSRIIVLHYLARATGAPLQGEQVSYEDIPGARHYLPVFETRVTKPLATAFGYNRDAFREAGIALGGKEEEYGDVSFTLFVFPKVPVTFILWEGDEEFPPSVRTLFDPSLPGYLSLEDIVVLSKLAASRIIKAARIRYADEAMA